MHLKHIRPLFVRNKMKIKIVELKLCSEYFKDIPIENTKVYGVEDAAPLFCSFIGDSNVEYVALLCLDSTNKIINLSKTAMGSIENVKVSIAQIIKTALLSNSSKVVVAHNHPSGVLKITKHDIEMTQKIGVIANFFDIILIDSLVVNGEKALSIREKVGVKNE